MELAHLLDAEEIKAIVGEVFPLAQARQAYERALQGHLQGKIVLRVAGAFIIFEDKSQKQAHEN